MAAAMGSSIDNKCGEHGPLGLYVSNIPRILVKALPEVGVEYIPVRGLRQTFPADPSLCAWACQVSPAFPSSSGSNSPPDGDQWTAQPLSSQLSSGLPDRAIHQMVGAVWGATSKPIPARCLSPWATPE
ncbi:hypothetical protein AMECASPLE_028286 [Ameca splendens]|uniref:Uncharacterized protein n=1 Tax=Ameca splendens TaxID=208324 RepID=A0ABV0YSH7_9TELE